MTTKEITKWTMRPDSCIEDRGGMWYVCVDSSDMANPLRFRNYGSGLDVVNAGVHGPFDSETNARLWLCEYDEESPNG